MGPVGTVGVVPPTAHQRATLLTSPVAPAWAWGLLEARPHLAGSRRTRKGPPAVPLPSLRCGRVSPGGPGLAARNELCGHPSAVGLHALTVPWPYRALRHGFYIFSGLLYNFFGLRKRSAYSLPKTEMSLFSQLFLPYFFFPPLELLPLSSGAKWAEHVFLKCPQLI